MANVVQNSFEDIGKQIEEKDSDNDGLKDWEEILWGTDINKADTDGDGYSDKQEADGGYDPLDPVSNEKTGKKGEPKEFIVPDISSSINLTNEISNIMGFQISQGVTEGTEPDLGDMSKLIDPRVNQNLAEFIASLNVRLSEKELKISQDNSSDAFQKYVNEFGAALLLFQNPILKKSPEEVFASAFQEKDFSQLNELISVYGQTAVKLKTIVVPSNFLSFHKRFIEILISLEKSLAAIKEIDRDPLKAMIGIQEGEKFNKEMMNLINEFVSLVKKYE